MPSLTKIASLVTVSAVLLAGQVATPALAQSTYYAHVHHSAAHYKTRSYLYRHPKVKSAVVGAGVGTAAGAITGLISHRGVMRGALIGAGTGAGVGLIRSSEVLSRHPIIKDTATGSAAGLGLGMAASRGDNAGLKGAAVGGAVGLGLGALKDVLR